MLWSCQTWPQSDSIGLWYQHITLLGGTQLDATHRKWTYKHKRNMFKLLNELLSSHCFYKSSSWDLSTVNWREFVKILQRHCRHCPRSENTKKYLSDTREPVKTSETHWQIRQIGGKTFQWPELKGKHFKTVKTFPWSGILRTHGVTILWNDFTKKKIHNWWLP